MQTSLRHIFIYMFFTFSETGKRILNTLVQTETPTTLVGRREVELTEAQKNSGLFTQRVVNFEDLPKVSYSFFNKPFGEIFLLLFSQTSK